MIFKYEAVDRYSKKQSGKIEALNVDVAINAIQQKGLAVISVKEEQEASGFLGNVTFLHHVKNKDVVILSRQMATLFNAQVSALRVFTLLSGETDNPQLKHHLREIADDLQAGSSISKALAKHPKVFSDFYVNMVKAGEESGKLDQTFNYLADYLDRAYEITSKVKNALVYPIFIVVVFISVMTFMMISVIPKISAILMSSNVELPIYTKIVIAISDVISNYGAFILAALIAIGFVIYRYEHTENGKAYISKARLSLPYIGTLFKKLYLSRMADNMNTMLASAIPIIKTLEITASVVGDVTYEMVLKEVVDSVRGGSPVSDALSKHPEIPGIMVQMVKVGEETGELGNILSTLAKFYTREVNNAVETIIGLIEPAMIIVLAVGVGILIASVIMPIYSLTSSIS